MKYINTILFFIIIAVFAYLMGPKPTKPSYPKFEQNIDFTGNTLEQALGFKEGAVNGLKKGCEAKVVWADSIKKAKTKLAILYIHGFSATHEEGNPVHRNLAKKYNANLFLARLAGHGIDLGDSTMINVTADDWYKSAEEALAIAKKLGDEVVVVATSFGGALSLKLANAHPEIKAIVMYSPCIKIYDDNAEILDNPWGLQIGSMVNGGSIRDFKAENDKHAYYWSTHYHMNATVQLQNFLTNTMNPETFAAVKCPVFMAYWYKNEEVQDKVVSVKAMLEMFDQLGSKTKEKVAITEAGNHVLASPILSRDIKTTEAETVKFLDKILL